MDLLLQTLKKRASFVAMNNEASKWVTSSFVLQFKPSLNQKDKTIFVGITATKRIGKAVHRNKAKRRLRALARETLPTQAVAGSYVLIARDKILHWPYSQMVQDLKWAIKRLITEQSERK